jgi:hypothetical protein
MPDESNDVTTQHNQAHTQRIAGRDYYENTFNSMSHYLASKPDVELDEVAIGNQRVFHARFCMDASRGVREQLITLQQHHDLTDREIRWLRRAGSIQVKGTQVTPTTSRSMVAIGWVQLSLISLMCISALFQVAFSSTPAWKQLLAQLAVAAVWVGCLWITHRLYIAPWRMLQRGAVK